MTDNSNEVYILNRGEHPAIKSRKYELLEFAKQPGLSKKLYVAPSLNGSLKTECTVVANYSGYITAVHDDIVIQDWAGRFHSLTRN